MGEQKKDVGTWWESNDGNRRYIAGRKTDGCYVIVECQDNRTVTVLESAISSYKPLKDCTGWDWQPDPEPECAEVCAMCGTKDVIQGTDGCKDCMKYAIESTGCPVESEWPKYYTANPPYDSVIAYIIRDSPTEYRMMNCHGTTSPNTYRWLPFDDQTRTQITKEQADAILVEKRPKPAESPDVCPITGLPERSMKAIVGELRRDLPPIPEPKPATQTIVFHEVIRTVVDDFGSTEWQLQWSTNPVKDDVKTGRTETREVV